MGTSGVNNSGIDAVPNHDSRGLSRGGSLDSSLAEVTKAKAPTFLSLSPATRTHAKWSPSSGLRESPGFPSRNSGVSVARRATLPPRPYSGAELGGCVFPAVPGGPGRAYGDFDAGGVPSSDRATSDIYSAIQHQNQRENLGGLGSTRKTITGDTPEWSSALFRLPVGAAGGVDGSRPHVASSVGSWRHQRVAIGVSSDEAPSRHAAATSISGGALDGQPRPAAGLGSSDLSSTSTAAGHGCPTGYLSSANTPGDKPQQAIALASTCRRLPVTMITALDRLAAPSEYAPPARLNRCNSNPTTTAAYGAPAADPSSGEDDGQVLILDGSYGMTQAADSFGPPCVTVAVGNLSSGCLPPRKGRQPPPAAGSPNDDQAAQPLPGGYSDAGMRWQAVSPDRRKWNVPHRMASRSSVILPPGATEGSQPAVQRRFSLPAVVTATARPAAAYRRTLSAPDERGALPERTPTVYRERIVEVGEERLKDCRWDGRPIEAMVFEGGGIKGIAYAGVVKCLEEAGLLKDVNCFGGTSAGSASAALCACGYSSSEVFKILQNTPWGSFKQGMFGTRLLRLLNRGGAFRTDRMCRWLEGHIQHKLGIKGCTFQQLHDRFGKELRVTAVSLTLRSYVVLARGTYPHMPISTACIASMSFPFVFTPLTYNRETFVDGGLLANLPTALFPGRKTLACNLVTTDEVVTAQRGPGRGLQRTINTRQAGVSGRRSSGGRQEANLQMVCSSMLAIILAAANSKYGQLVNDKETDVDIVDIPTDDMSVFDLDISSEDCDGLFAAGYKATSRYVSAGP